MVNPKVLPDARSDANIRIASTSVLARPALAHKPDWT